MMLEMIRSFALGAGLVILPVQFLLTDVNIVTVSSPPVCITCSTRYRRHHERRTLTARLADGVVRQVTEVFSFGIL
jgi:hypothetical protein